MSQNRAEKLLNKLAGQKPAPTATAAETTTPRATSSSSSSMSTHTHASSSSSLSSASGPVVSASSGQSVAATEIKEETKEIADETSGLDISRNELAAIAYLKEQPAQDLKEAADALLKPRPGRIRSYALLMHLVIPTREDQGKFFNQFPNSNRELIRQEINNLLAIYLVINPAPPTELDLNFPDTVKGLIIGYLDDAPLPQRSSYRHYPLTLFDNIARLYSAQTANLILELSSTSDMVVASFRQHASMPACIIDALDHRGRKLKGTPLQIAAMTGEFNFTENPEEKTKEGYVEHLWDELPEAEARRQLRAVFPENWQAITDARMQPYVTAVEIFMQAIIGAKATEYAALEIELKEEIETFNKAFTPHPNQIITSGLVFDPKVILTAINLFESKVGDLKGYWSAKSDLFWIRGIGTLQANTSERDFRIIKKGIGNDNVGSSSRDVRGPVDMSLGGVFYLGYYGHADRRARTSLALHTGVRGARYKTYVEQKHRRCKTYAAIRQSAIGFMSRNV